MRKYLHTWRSILFSGVTSAFLVALYLEIAIRSKLEVIIGVGVLAPFFIFWLAPIVSTQWLILSIQRDIRLFRVAMWGWFSFLTMWIIILWYLRFVKGANIPTEDLAIVGLICAAGLVVSVISAAVLRSTRRRKEEELLDDDFIEK